jgi:hypothetical protein
MLESAIRATLLDLKPNQILEQSFHVPHLQLQRRSMEALQRQGVRTIDMGLAARL